ncbi:MAG: sporulation protein YabP [Ruminococcus sp.]|nr:sporulation protein YabP [Candidatus Apopatosoma intestinale]
MPESANKPSSHEIVIQNRSKAQITGVTDVIRFDEYEIGMETSDGELTVEGSDLHISRLSLDTGDVHIDGSISAVRYEDAESGKKKSGFFRR